MINSKICLDKRINDLSDDTSRLAFTWLITFADVEGRVSGDPAIVKSMLFPRRTDISPEQIQVYIQEWAASKLIIWYEADGDLWIYFLGFEKNQKIRKDREAPSYIPAPQLKSDSGETPEQLPDKLNEINRTEVERATADVFKSYENNIGPIVQYISDELKEALAEYPAQWIIDAIGLAVENNARNWRYISAILKRWQTDGKDSGRGKPAPKPRVEVWSEEHY